MKQIAAFIFGLILLCVGLNIAQSNSVLHPKQHAWSFYDLGWDTQGGMLSEWGNSDDHGTSFMTDDGSGLISRWCGRGGKVCFSAATTARPTWDAASWTSSTSGTYSAITCNGTANGMTFAPVGGITTIPVGSTASEFWILGRYTAAVGTATSRDPMTQGGNTNANRRVLQLQNTTNPTFQVSDATVNSTTYISFTNPATGAGPIGLPDIMGGFWSGTSADSRANGYASFVPGTGVTPNPVTIGSLNTDSTRIRLCANSTNGLANFWPGLVKQWAIIRGVLSTINKQRIEGAFACSVNEQAILPNNHPFRFSCPYI